MANGYTELTGSVKTASILSLIAGAWFFVSPWVYGAYGNPDSWNSWIVGGVIVIFSAVQLGTPSNTRTLSFLNMLLGAWTFASPWIYGYTFNTGRFINSLCVGVAVFILAAFGSTAGGPRTLQTPRTPPPLRP